jgi:hypothetical protein
MTLLSRLACALRGPARSLVWAWAVTLVLLTVVGLGQDLVSSQVAIVQSESIAIGEPIAQDGVPGASEPVTVVEIIDTTDARPRLNVGCRERAVWSVSGVDAVVCDVQASLTDLPEPVPGRGSPHSAETTWLRIGRLHSPPDPTGTAPVPLLRPPAV